MKRGGKIVGYLCLYRKYEIKVGRSEFWPEKYMFEIGYPYHPDDMGCGGFWDTFEEAKERALNSARRQVDECKRVRGEGSWAVEEVPPCSG